MWKKESTFGLQILRSSRSAATLLKIAINKGLFLLLCASVRTRDGNCGFKVWFGECVGTDRKLIERQRTERNSVWNKRKREAEKAPTSGPRTGESCISWKLMMTFRWKPTRRGDESPWVPCSPEDTHYPVTIREKREGVEVTSDPAFRAKNLLISYTKKFSRRMTLLELCPAS